MLPEGGVGNLIAIPLQKKALKDGNIAFIDSNCNGKYYGVNQDFRNKFY